MHGCIGRHWSYGFETIIVYHDIVVEPGENFGWMICLQLHAVENGLIGIHKHGGVAVKIGI